MIHSYTYYSDPSSTYIVHLTIILLYRCMGATLDSSSNQCNVELGDGVEEVVSWLEDSNILWITEREENETSSKFFMR